MRFELALNSLDKHPSDLEDFCTCSLLDNPSCMMTIEEGQASLTHQACGKPLWFEPEDISAEVAVKVAVETCSNPGGWHGDMRCDCGYTVLIALEDEDK